jgi:hypothetical protein
MLYIKKRRVCIEQHPVWNELIRLLTFLRHVPLGIRTKPHVHIGFRTKPQVPLGIKDKLHVPLGIRVKPHVPMV